MNGMDRLAFTTLACPEWNFETIVDKASAMGYRALEIRGIGPELNTAKLPCFLPENRSRAAALLEEKGLVICGIGTSASLHEEGRLPQALAEAREALDIANAMGIPAVRVFGDSLPERESQDIIVNRVARALEELCRYAADNGRARVLLEIHGDFNTAEVLEPLLERVGRNPAFGLIWDIQHTWRAYGADHTRIYPLIAPYVRHVHLKDCGPDVAAQPACLPGEGVIPIRETVKLLEGKGYDGFYSFEWEKRWHPEIPGPEAALPAFVEYMRNIAFL